MFIPVVNLDNKPLMPTIPSRAKRMILSKIATPFWKKGVFCIRLNKKTEENKQIIAAAIDPGSKKEGFTVKSKAHTYLNIQTDAVTWVKDAIKTRRNARRNRRYRKTPYRKQRLNRKKGGISPSTKARWQWKLRMLNWLKKIYPITHIVVEDIKAKTMGRKRWDKSFSPLEVGKKYFYNEVSKLGELSIKQGWETKELRDKLGLKKSKNKLSNNFDAHCVDSWILANSVVGGHDKPDDTNVLLIKPLRFHRRQLHVFVPSKGGKRKNYGGTRSFDFKRGSLVKHKKYGVVYVGGTSNERISLHSTIDGKRLTQDARVEDCKFLCYNSWN
jgi:hypothetical protein